MKKWCTWECGCVFRFSSSNVYRRKGGKDNGKEQGEKGGWNLVCLTLNEWNLNLNLVWAHNPVYKFVFLYGVGMTGWGTKQGPRRVSKDAVLVTARWGCVCAWGGNEKGLEENTEGKKRRKKTEIGNWESKIKSRESKIGRGNQKFEICQKIWLVLQFNIKYMIK